jgi:hypothetical protein
MANRRLSSSKTLKGSKSKTDQQQPAKLQPSSTLEVAPADFSVVHCFISILHRAPANFRESLKCLLGAIECDLNQEKSTILGTSIFGEDDRKQSVFAIEMADRLITRLTSPERIAEEIEEDRKEKEKEQLQQQLAERFEKEKDTWFHGSLADYDLKIEQLPITGTLRFKQRRGPNLSEKDAQAFEFRYEIRKRAAKKKNEPDTYSLRLRNDFAEQVISYKSRATKRAGRYIRSIICPGCGKEQMVFAYIDDLRFLCTDCRPRRYDGFRINNNPVHEYLDAWLARGMGPSVVSGGVR